MINANSIAKVQKIDTFQMNSYEKTRMRVAYTKGATFREFSNKNIWNIVQSNNTFLHKITFVNFSFQACHSCVMEEPKINNLYKRYKLNKNFQIINFTFDPPTEIKKYIKAKKLLYKNFISIPRNRCYDLNYQSGYPTAFVVDSNGKIQFARAGGGNDDEEIKLYFQKDFIPLIDSLLTKLNTH